MIKGFEIQALSFAIRITRYRVKFMRVCDEYNNLNYRVKIIKL